MSSRIITPVAVLSYPHFDKAQAGPNNGPAKFSGTFVFDADAKKTPQFAAMKEAALQAAKDKFGESMTVGGKKISI